MKKIYIRAIIVAILLTILSLFVNTDIPDMIYLGMLGVLLLIYIYKGRKGIDDFLEAAD